MWRLSLAFLDIALHRRGPEDMPPSRFLFGFTLVCLLSVGLVSSFISTPPVRILELPSLGVSIRFGFVKLMLFETAADLCFIWLVLWAFNHSRRFLQTATAILGVETLLACTALPFLAWNAAISSASGELTAASFLYLILFLWSLDVAGFVLARATENAYFVTLPIVIGYVIMSIFMRQHFLPAAG